MNAPVSVEPPVSQAADPPIRRFWSRVAVITTALTLGAMFAAAGSWLAWRPQPPAPTRAQALAALEIGLPGVPVSSIGWHDDVRDVHGIARPTSRNLPGQQQASYTGAVRREMFDAARARLAAAGWRVRSERNFFVATRGVLVMEWEFFPAGTYDSPSGDWIEVWLWSFTPGPVRASLLVGWLLGGMVGGGSARAVARRSARFRRPARMAVVTIVLLALAPSTYWVASATVHDLLDVVARNGQPVAPWYGYFPFLLPFGFDIG
jgi:hypothetical protein